MDRTLITAITLICLSALIAGFGVYYGDQIEASVPGGKATGIIGGVILLLGLFVTSYKSIASMDKNILDREGFMNILELHFDSVSHQLLFVFGDAIAELEENPDTFNFDMVVVNSRRVIDKSRSRLKVFKTSKISNIPKFLDNYFSPDMQQQYLNQCLEIVKSSEGTQKKNKLAFQLIQSIQSDLLNKLEKDQYS